MRLAGVGLEAVVVVVVVLVWIVVVILVWIGVGSQVLEARVLIVVVILVWIGVGSQVLKAKVLIGIVVVIHSSTGRVNIFFYFSPKVVLILIRLETGHIFVRWGFGFRTRICLVDRLVLLRHL